ncbi:MAG: ATP-binding cassette domain-containing protein [Kiritimatiellae bacterium]|nr:ATP-binding cassette domain-containing protein [Kiritimatiellia bacterium]
MRACVTGRNGEGKSTLLKVIAGRLEPDAGEVVRAPGLKTAFLEQEVPSDRPGTVAEIAGSGKYTSQMGLDPAAEFNSLSGGMRRRVLLARVLADEPDLVLLDEPTNHLDVASIEWLEAFIRRQTEMSFLFVTHDRTFLKSVSTYVYDLDRGLLSGWNCDYRTFLQRKADLQADEAALWARKAKKLAQEEAWIRQGVKARRTRNQGRVEALRKLRLEFASRRAAAGASTLKLDAAAASGDRVIKVEDISFAYPGGEPIVRGFTADVLRGERIGVIGENGAGKTTLLKLLVGQLAPTSGAVTLGTRVEMAFFDQLHAQLDPESTVKEVVAKDRDAVTVGGVTKHVFAYLADFLFAPERARTPVKALSGGEKARLLLARLFLKPSNLLVMDEPTNDLDVETLELLEEQLLNYKGTLLVVSHDREFLDNVATSSYVLAGDGEVRACAGGYAEAARLLRRIKDLKAPKDIKAPMAPNGPKGLAPASPSKAKLTYNEKRELDALPAAIAALEREIAEIESALADPSAYARDNARATALAARLPQARDELDATETRWLELSERA